MTPSDLDLGWAVGLFEGEGSISHTKASCVRLSLATTDRDVRDRFHQIVGVGSLGGWQGQPPRKYTYQWYVDGHAAAALLHTLLPHLGERRRAKAHEALALRETHIAKLTAIRACPQCDGAFVSGFRPGIVQQYCSVFCREKARYARRREQRRKAA